LRMSAAANAECRRPMLPTVAAAPDAKNDRRDKWMDWLGLGILVLPGFVMAFAGVTSAWTFLMVGLSSSD
jgi:hypothetical protein